MKVLHDPGKVMTIYTRIEKCSMASLEVCQLLIAAQITWGYDE